jgi:hypothetical protein
MAPVTACRINLAVDHMKRDIISPMDQFPVRPVSELDWRLDLQLVGMAIIAERAGMTGSTETLVLPYIKPVLFYELR